MSIPPKREKTEFEKCPIGLEIKGTIFEVQENMNKDFKYKKDGEIITYQAPGVRFVFELEGQQYKKYSRWMRFQYTPGYDLLDKYLTSLVDNVSENMAFDIQDLSGMPIITVWEESNNFQSVSTIKPQGDKCTFEGIDADGGAIEPTEDESPMPF